MTTERKRISREELAALNKLGYDLVLKRKDNGDDFIAKAVRRKEPEEIKERLTTAGLSEMEKLNAHLSRLLPNSPIREKEEKPQEQETIKSVVPENMTKKERRKMKKKLPIILVQTPKYYKDFEKVFIGFSDIASLTLRGCSEEGELLLQNLKFGGDGTYHAYFIKGNAIIGDHYEKVGEFHHWLEIFDDESKTMSLRGDTINVFRAGDYGCIIQVM